MNEKLKNKTAVVTGAGGELCSEMARNLAGQGVKVALLGRTLEKLKKVEDEITQEGGNAMSVSADVINVAELEKAQVNIRESFGTCDILINGAGGNQAEAVTTVNEFDEKELDDSGDIRGFFNLDMDKFNDVIQTNTMGTVLPCYIFGRDMAQNRSGNIINMASMTSYAPLSRVGAYAMAKAGIVNFTQWLATYLAPANIRVNAIAPGFFPNDRSRKMLTTSDGGYTSRGGSIMNRTPMNEFGEARQLTGCMNWLIDDEAADFVTGITIPIDGGFLADPGVK